MKKYDKKSKKHEEFVEKKLEVIFSVYQVVKCRFQTGIF